jgi:hypothetical protein
MKQSISDRALRRWFPKRYIHMMKRRRAIEYKEQLKTIKADARQELEAVYNFDMRDFDEWLTSIQDEELIENAARMDLSIDDIPMFERGNGLVRTTHWEFSGSGNEVLYFETRRALQKLVRERAPSYRKERREMQEFYLKVVLGVGGSITGIGGTLIGIIALWKK